MISLTKKQVQQLSDLMHKYPDSDSVIITYGYACSIGTNVYATIKYCVYKEHQIDITDYESW